MNFLIANGSFSAVAWVHHNHRRKHEQLRFYAIYQRIKISARQISSPYAHIKKHIARHNKFLCPTIKGNTSRRMSGGEKYFNSIFTQGDEISFIDICYVAIILIKGQPKHEPRSRRIIK